MSSKSRSPTKTRRVGSCTPTACIAARNASGAGFVHGISLVYTAPSIISSTPSRRKYSSCQALGHTVFDSTPTLIPSTLSRLNNVSTSSSANVACSQKDWYPARCASSKGTPANAQISSKVAERCSSRERAHTVSAASSSAAVASSARPGAANPASAAHSCTGSIVRHGVRVPPQSKMTASMLDPTRSAFGDRAADRFPNSRQHGGYRVVDRHVVSFTAGAVLDLHDAFGQALADHDDGGHA